LKIQQWDEHVNTNFGFEGEYGYEPENIEALRFESGKERRTLKNSWLPLEFPLLSLQLDNSERGPQGLTEFERFKMWYERSLQYGTLPFQMPMLGRKTETATYMFSRDSLRYDEFKSPIEITFGLVEVGGLEELPDPVKEWVLEQITRERQKWKQGDVETLESANGHTDARITEALEAVEEQINNLQDQRPLPGAGVTVGADGRTVSLGSIALADQAASFDLPDLPAATVQNRIQSLRNVARLITGNTFAAALSLTVDMADLQTTLNNLPLLLKRNVTINVRPGTINTQIELLRFYGPGTLTINAINASGGNINTPAESTNHRINHRLVIHQCSARAIIFRGFDFIDGTRTSIDLAQNSGALIEIRACNLAAGIPGNDANRGILAHRCSSRILLRDCAIANKGRAVTSEGSLLVLQGVTGNNNQRLAISRQGGHVAFWGSSISVIEGSRVESLEGSIGVIDGVIETPARNAPAKSNTIAPNTSPPAAQNTAIATEGQLAVLRNAIEANSAGIVGPITASSEVLSLAQIEALFMNTDGSLLKSGLYIVNAGNSFRLRGLPANQTTHLYYSVRAIGQKFIFAASQNNTLRFCAFAQQVPEDEMLDWRLILAPTTSGDLTGIRDLVNIRHLTATGNITATGRIIASERIVATDRVESETEVRAPLLRGLLHDSGRNNPLREQRGFEYSSYNGGTAIPGGTGLRYQINMVNVNGQMGQLAFPVNQNDQPIWYRMIDDDGSVRVPWRALAWLDNPNFTGIPTINGHPAAVAANTSNPDEASLPIGSYIAVESTIRYQANTIVAGSIGDVLVVQGGKYTITDDASGEIVINGIWRSCGSLWGTLTIARRVA